MMNIANTINHYHSYVIQYGQSIVNEWKGRVLVSNAKWVSDSAISYKIITIATSVFSNYPTWLSSNTNAYLLLRDIKDAFSISLKTKLQQEVARKSRTLHLIPMDEVVDCIIQKRHSTPKGFEEQLNDKYQHLERKYRSILTKLEDLKSQFDRKKFDSEKYQMRFQDIQRSWDEVRNLLKDNAPMLNVNASLVLKDISMALGISQKEVDRRVQLFERLHEEMSLLRSYIKKAKKLTANANISDEAIIGLLICPFQNCYLKMLWPYLLQKK